MTEPNAFVDDDYVARASLDEEAFREAVQRWDVTLKAAYAELAWDLVQRDGRGEFYYGDDSMCPFDGCSGQGDSRRGVRWPHESTCPVTRARMLIARALLQGAP